MTSPAEIQTHPEQQKNIDPALQNLAQRVKGKDQVLFERISGIVEANAQKSAQDQISALRGELSVAEKKTISDIAQSQEVSLDVRQTAQQVSGSEHEENIATVLRGGGVKGAGVLSAGGVVLQEIAGEVTNLKGKNGFDLLEGMANVFESMEKKWDKLVLSIASSKAGKWLLEAFGIDIPQAESVADGVGTTGQEAFVKGKEMTEEKKREIEEKTYGEFSSGLKKQYGLNTEEKLSDGTTKGEKLRAILKKRIEGLHSTFVDEHGDYILRPIEDIYVLMSTGKGIIYDLFKEGVLDSSNMTFDFVNTAEGTVRYVVKSVSGVELSHGLEGEISLDNLSDDMKPSEKMFLLAVFYRKGGFVTSVLGNVAFLLAQPMRLLNSFDNIGTRSVWFPGLNRKIEKMDQVINILTKVAPEKTEDIAALKLMRNEAENSRKAIEVVMACKEKKITYEVAKNELNLLLGNYNKLGQEKTFIAEHLGFDAWNKAYLKDIFIKNNTNYIELLMKSIESGYIAPTFAKIASHVKFLEVPGDINRTAMYFRNPKDFSEFMKELGVLASQSPEAVKGLLSHLPVFIVAGVTIHEGMKPDGDVAKSLPYLFPIIGPILMLNEASVKVNHETGQITTEGMVESVAGAALLGVDGFTLVTLIGAEGSILKGTGKLLLKPVVDTARALGSLVRFSGSLWKVGADGARLGAEFFARGPLPNMKIVAGVLAGIAVLALTGEVLASDSPEEIKQKLIKKGFYNADGTPNFVQLKEGFKKMSEEDKKQILDLVVSLETASYQVDQFVDRTEYKKGIYTIKTTKEHKDIIEKTLLSTDIYSEFELVDNIRIELIES